MDMKLNFPQGDAIYMFFETKSSITSQGDIAAAVSKDSGATWQQLGVVLDEEWHLSYPYVFSYDNKVNKYPIQSCLFAIKKFCFFSFSPVIFYLPHAADLYDA